MMVSVVFDASDESVLDMDNLIGLVGYTAFVGYHHDGHSLFLVQFLQQVHHFHARFGVEGSGRLIGKDDFGFGDEGTGDGYTLLLSSRHLVGIMVGPLLQAQFFEIFHRQFVALLAAHALVEEWKLHVFHRRLERDEVERLEDEADHLVAVFGSTGFREVFDEHIIESVFARIVVVENTQYI